MVGGGRKGSFQMVGKGEALTAVGAWGNAGGERQINGGDTPAVNFHHKEEGGIYGRKFMVAESECTYDLGLEKKKQGRG